MLVKGELCGDSISSFTDVFVLFFTLILIYMHFQTVHYCVEISVQILSTFDLDATFHLPFLQLVVLLGYLLASRKSKKRKR